MKIKNNIFLLLIILMSSIVFADLKTIKQTDIIYLEYDNNVETMMYMQDGFIYINITQLSTSSGYKWDMALCPIDVIGSIEKFEYNQKTDVYSSTGDISYNRLWGYNDTWCINTDNYGYGIASSGSGNKYLKLNISGINNFKIYTGTGTEIVKVNNYDVVVYYGKNFNITAKLYNNDSYLKNAVVDEYKFHYGKTEWKNMTYEIESSIQVIKKLDKYYFKNQNQLINIKTEDICNQYNPENNLSSNCKYNYGYNETTEKYFLKINFYGNDTDPEMVFSNIDDLSYYIENITKTGEFYNLLINDSKLIAYYSFDIDNFDSTSFKSLTGSTYDLTITNNIEYTENGKYSSGAYSNAGGYASNEEIFDTESPTNFSVSWWIKAGKNVNYNQGMQANNEWGAWKFHTDSNGGIYCGQNSNSRFTPSDTGNGFIVEDEWVHVVYTYNGSTGKLYKNGELNATKELTPSGESWSGFRIGDPVAGETLNGTIDELMIYNKTLSAGEISSIYDASINRFYQVGNIQPTPFNIKGNYNKITVGIGFINNSNVSFRAGYVAEPFDYNETDDDLLLYMHADENALDSSGYGNNGTFYNNATANVTGIWNNSFYFDGTKDYIEIPHDETLNISTQNFSISMFVKIPESATGVLTLLDKRAPSTLRGFQTLVTDTEVRLQLTDDTETKNYATTANVKTDSWNHITYNIDKSSNKIYYYINGILFDEDTITNTGSYENIANLRIGTGSTGANDLEGNIEELMIFNRTLSNEEIADIARYGRTEFIFSDYSDNFELLNQSENYIGLENMEDLVLYHHADNNTNDSSSYGNDGTFGGNANFSTDTIWDYSYNFDGDGDYVNIGTGLNDVPLSDFTLSFWAKLQNGYEQDTAAISFDGADDIVIYPYDTANGNGVRVFWRDFGGNIIDENDATRTGWNHFLFTTKYNKTQSIYVNGNLEGTTTLTGNAGTFNRFVIGAFGLGGQGFNGTIDEVMVLNKTLSDSEIKAIFYRGSKIYAEAEVIIPENQDVVSLDIKVDDSSFIPSYVSDAISVNYSYEQQGIPTEIDFIAPTAPNYAITKNRTVNINVSIKEENLTYFIYNWNGTNYTIYNDNLDVMYNFDNVSSIGDNSTYIIDLSTAKNNLTLYNDPKINSSGVWGSAIQFDGINDKGIIGDGTYLDSGQSTITVSMWVKVTKDQTGYFLSKAWSGGYPIEIVYDAGDNKINWISDTSGNSLRSGAINLDEWYHFVFVGRSGSKKIYINGKLNTSNSGYGGVRAASDYDLTLGARSTNSEYLDGLIDELRIFNTNLSSDEVYNLYVSNLRRINKTNWNYYIEQSKNATDNLDIGNYTYYGYVNNSNNLDNSTEIRTISIQNPYIGLELLNPILSNVNVTQYEWFNITVNVSCISEVNCGEINVSFDPIDGCDCENDDCSSCSEMFIPSLSDPFTNNDYFGICAFVTDGCYQTDGSFNGYGTAKDSDCDGVLGSGTGDCAFFDDIVSTGDAMYCPSYERKGSAVTSSDCVEINCMGGGSIDADSIFDFTNEFFAGSGGVTKGLINTTEGATPFYTNMSNPYNISLNFGESELINFWINASGDYKNETFNATYEFFVYANTTDFTGSNITNIWNVTIIEKISPIVPFPNVSFISPANNSLWEWGENILINISSNGADTVWWNNGTTNNTYISEENITGLDIGEYTYIVYANNSLNDVTINYTTFIVEDTIFPQIEFVNPTPENNTSVFQYLPINITALDNYNISNITINIYDSNNNLIYTNTTDLIENLYINKSLQFGNYSFNATVCDISNNCNSTKTRNVFINNWTSFYTLNVDIEDFTFASDEWILIKDIKFNTSKNNITVFIANAFNVLQLNKLFDSEIYANITIDNVTIFSEKVRTSTLNQAGVSGLDTFSIIEDIGEHELKLYFRRDNINNNALISIYNYDFTLGSPSAISGYDSRGNFTSFSTSFTSLTPIKVYEKTINKNVNTSTYIKAKLFVNSSTGEDTINCYFQNSVRSPDFAVTVPSVDITRTMSALYITEPELKEENISIYCFSENGEDINIYGSIIEQDMADDFGNKDNHIFISDTNINYSNPYTVTEGLTVITNETFTIKNGSNTFLSAYGSFASLTGEQTLNVELALYNSNGTKVCNSYKNRFTNGDIGNGFFDKTCDNLTIGETYNIILIFNVTIGEQILLYDGGIAMFESQELDIETINTPPIIAILNPEGDNYVNGTSNINWSISDSQSDITLTNITLEDGTNYSIAENISYNITNYLTDWTIYNDDYYNLTLISCENETVEKYCGESTINIEVDNNPPIFTEINNGTFNSQENVNVSIQAYDNVDIKNFTVNNTNFIINYSGIIEQYKYGYILNNTNLSIQNYSLNVCAYSYTSKFNCTNITIEITEPPTFFSKIMVWRNNLMNNVSWIDQRGNMWIDGNLNVSGCIIYNGGQLGVCK